MSRQSNDFYENGRLIAGYDYINQAWVIDGRYQNCGHPETMKCDCYGRKHLGETTQPGRLDGSEPPTEKEKAFNWEEVDKATDAVKKDMIDKEGPDILTGPSFSQYYTQRRAALRADLDRVTRKAAELDEQTALGRGTLLARECIAARLSELDRARHSTGPDGYPDASPHDLPSSTLEVLRKTFTTFKG